MFIFGSGRPLSTLLRRASEAGLVFVGTIRRRHLTARSGAPVLAVAFAALLAAPEAEAASLLPIVDGRRVQLIATDFFPPPPEPVLVPDPEFSDFDALIDIAASSADQDSTLRATLNFHLGFNRPHSSEIAQMEIED